MKKKKKIEKMKKNKKNEKKWKKIKKREIFFKKMKKKMKKKKQKKAAKNTSRSTIGKVNIYLKTKLQSFNSLPFPHCRFKPSWYVLNLFMWYSSRISLYTLSFFFTFSTTDIFISDWLWPGKLKWAPVDMLSMLLDTYLRCSAMIIIVTCSYFQIYLSSFVFLSRFV